LLNDVVKILSLVKNILRNVHQVFLLCVKQCCVCSCKEQPKLEVPYKSKVVFFLAISQFDWPIAKKSSNYGSSSKIEDFMGKMKCHLFWTSSIGEKGRTLAKTYGIKARCYLCV